MLLCAKLYMELMEPESEQWEKANKQEWLQKGLQQGLQQGIQGTVNVLKRCGHGEVEIREIIIEQFNLSVEEAEGYLKA